MPYTPAPSEYYPKIYPSSSLSIEQIADVEKHQIITKDLKSLQKILTLAVD